MRIIRIYLKDGDTVFLAFSLPNAHFYTKLYLNVHKKYIKLRKNSILTDMTSVKTCAYQN